MMSPESDVDPRGRPLHPTHDEIDAWAAREHKRRAAWLAGPGEDEKRDWARRYRWRAFLSLEESRLGPTHEEIEHWAAREHQRREAWLAGPSDTQKTQWAAAQRQRHAAEPGAAAAEPAAVDVEAWAARERQRRQEWLAGPTAEEKAHWAQRESRGLFDELTDLPSRFEADLPESAQRILREAELVGKGTFYALSRAPLDLWSRLVRAGRAFEREFDAPPRRRRVRY
jgi:hypothetical protein